MHGSDGDRVPEGEHALRSARRRKSRVVLSFGIQLLPDVVREWRDKRPDEAIPDGSVLTQPWLSTSDSRARGIPDRVWLLPILVTTNIATTVLVVRYAASMSRSLKARRAVNGHAPLAVIAWIEHQTG